jgi:hypothetical protein
VPASGCGGLLGVGGGGILPLGDTKKKLKKLAVPRIFLGKFFLHIRHIFRKIKLKSPHLPKTCLWKFSNKTHRWRTTTMHDRKEEEQEEEVTGDPSITRIKKNSNMQA